MQERDYMIDKSSQAGYHLSYTMYIMEEMIDFIKNNKGKTISEKMELLKKDRWLGQPDFMQRADKWLNICEEQPL
jgi:hypothetical protein